jgi:hypothetical protein
MKMTLPFITEVCIGWLDQSDVWLDRCSRSKEMIFMTKLVWQHWNLLTNTLLNPCQNSLRVGCFQGYDFLNPYPYSSNPYAQTHGFTLTPAQPYPRVLPRVPEVNSSDPVACEASLCSGSCPEPFGSLGISPESPFSLSLSLVDTTPLSLLSRQH